MSNILLIITHDVLVFYCCLTDSHKTSDLNNANLLSPHFCGSGVQALFGAFLSHTEIKFWVGLWSYLRLHVLLQIHTLLAKLRSLVWRGPVGALKGHITGLWVWSQLASIWKATDQSFSLSPFLILSML